MGHNTFTTQFSDPTLRKFSSMMSLVGKFDGLSKFLHAKKLAERHRASRGYTKPGWHGVSGLRTVKDAYGPILVAPRGH